MSDVILKYAIVHKLVKEQRKPIKPTEFRDSVLDPNNATVKQLVQGVLKAYGADKNRAHYGVFSEGEERKYFPKYFDSYSSKKSSDENDFMSLCKMAMTQLYMKAESQHLASGGYILFADYTHMDINFFLVAMIKETAGIAISHSLEPEALIRLDLDKLHQAARINFSKYNEFLNADSDDEKSQINYLSFVSSGRNVTASGYFVTALGCSRGTTSDRATKTIIEESVKYFRDNQSLKKNKESFKKSLIEYLSDRESIGESVRLTEVGQIVSAHIPMELADESSELVENLLTHLNSDQCAVPVEFPVSKRELRKKTHIKVDTDNWKVEFDRKALGEIDSAPVYYNRVAGSLTFKNIPQKMRDALDHELSERNPD